MSTAIASIAKSNGASQEEVTNILKGMIVSAKNQHGAVATDSELAVVASVCDKYKLNPLVKECAAFISGGKLQVIVMIDGWYSLVNRQENFDGVEFVDHKDDSGNLTAIECRMHVKGRKFPSVAIEYMAECMDKKSSVWSRWPARMLRHKAYIQAARMAFGYSDIIDNDEANRIKSNSRVEKDITPSAKETGFDFAELSRDLSECADDDSIKAIAAKARQDLQKLGLWEQHKDRVIELRNRHGERVARDYAEFDSNVAEELSAQDDGIEEAEFSESDEAGQGETDANQDDEEIPFD